MKKILSLGFVVGCAVLLMGCSGSADESAPAPKGNPPEVKAPDANMVPPEQRAQQGGEKGEGS